MKVQKNFRLTEFAINYIEECSNKWGIDKTECVERIIREHQKNNKEEIYLIAEAVIDSIDNNYKDMIKRLKLSTNFTDKNVQILMEILNTILIENDYQSVHVSSVDKSPILTLCENFVTNRIAHAKQMNNNG